MSKLKVRTQITWLLCLVDRIFLQPEASGALLFSQIIYYKHIPSWKRQVNPLEMLAYPVLYPRILSLDGGGVRGLSSLIVLREIMYHIQRETEQDRTPDPYEYFDLIGGTSTGGLIATMLGRLRMVNLPRS